MKSKIKTVGDLLDLLKELDPNTELWVQNVKDDQECLPVINLPRIKTIIKMTYEYISGGTKTLWVVDNNFFDEEEKGESKKVVIWNK